MASKPSAGSPSERVAKPLLVFSMVCFGTTWMCLTKVLFQTSAINMDGKSQIFDRPYFSSALTFFGEILCIPIFLIHRTVRMHRLKREQRSADISVASRGSQSLGYEDTSIQLDPKPVSLSYEMTGGHGFGKLIGWTIALGCSDVVAGLLLSNAILFCPASIVQILRGTVTIFAMILRRLYLKEKPARWQIFGVSVVIIGLVLVSLSTILDQKTTIDDIRVGIGIAMAIVGQLFSANLYVLEEKFMKKYNFPPLVTVGFEGIATSVILFCIICPIVNAIPGSDHGSVESYRNSFYMMLHNTDVGVMCLAIIFVTAFWVASAITVNRLFSSIHMTLFACLKIITIWAVMVVVYYASHHAFGQKVDAYSALELGGFGLVTLGTILHNDLWDVGKKVTCYKQPILSSAKLSYSST